MLALCAHALCRNTSNAMHAVLHLHDTFVSSVMMYAAKKTVAGCHKNVRTISQWLRASLVTKLACRTDKVRARVAKGSKSRVKSWPVIHPTTTTKGLQEHHRSNTGDDARRGGCHLAILKDNPRQ